MDGLADKQPLVRVESWGILKVLKPNEEAPHDYRGYDPTQLSMILLLSIRSERMVVEIFGFINQESPNARVGILWGVPQAIMKPLL
jgi:hypothetical protein